jgi:hypothetical protein
VLDCASFLGGWDFGHVERWYWLIGFREKMVILMLVVSVVFDGWFVAAKEMCEMF